MKRLAVVVALVLSAPLSAQSDARFIEAIEPLISTPQLRHAIWGIRIEREDGTALYDRNSETLLAPASNRKLSAAAFAASCLGIDTRLETRILITGEVGNGVLNGDVVIAGDGDPSLGGRFDHDRDAVFAPVVAALRSRGIRSVTGGVVADVSLFDDDTIPGSWKNDNLGLDYATPVDALAWNENVIGFRVEAVGNCSDPVAMITTDPTFPPATAEIACGGEEQELLYRTDASNRLRLRVDTGSEALPVVMRELAAVEDPALYAAQALDHALERFGITTSTEPRVSRQRVAGSVLDTIESPPVGVLLATVLEVSQNLYAEMLLKRAAAAVVSSPVSYSDALAAEERFLATIGVDPDQVDFVDGSGLSPDDLITNRALISIVRWIAQPERAGFFGQVLARPLGEGTLRYRLGGYESRIAGKTGTINTVAALSGWAITPSGEKRFFSIIVNHHTASTREARTAIDAIARIAADL